MRLLSSPYAADPSAAMIGRAHHRAQVHCDSISLDRRKHVTAADENARQSATKSMAFVVAAVLAL